MHFVRGFSLPQASSKCLIQETNVELQGSKRLGGLPTAASQGVQRRERTSKEILLQTKMDFSPPHSKTSREGGGRARGVSARSPEAERGLAVDGENPL